MRNKAAGDSILHPNAMKLLGLQVAVCRLLVTGFELTEEISMVRVGLKLLPTILCNCYVILFTLQVQLKKNRFEWEKGQKHPSFCSLLFQKIAQKSKSQNSRTASQFLSFSSPNHSLGFDMHLLSTIPNAARRSVFSVLFFDNLLFIYGDWIVSLMLFSQDLAFKTQ